MLSASLVGRKDYWSAAIVGEHKIEFTARARQPPLTKRIRYHWEQRHCSPAGGRLERTNRAELVGALAHVEFVTRRTEICSARRVDNLLNITYVKNLSLEK
jgi:hypothetical protein